MDQVINSQIHIHFFSLLSQPITEWSFRGLGNENSRFTSLPEMKWKHDIPLRDVFRRQSRLHLLSFSRLLRIPDRGICPSLYVLFACVLDELEGQGGGTVSAASSSLRRSLSRRWLSFPFHCVQTFQVPVSTICKASRARLPLTLAVFCENVLHVWVPVYAAKERKSTHVSFSVFCTIPLIMKCSIPEEECVKAHSQFKEE